MKASFPTDFRPFFSLLRKPGRLCRPDCRSVVLCVAFAVLLRRNERVFALRRGFWGTPLLRLHLIPIPLVFPAGKTVHPRGRNHTSNWQADHATRDRARETRRKRAGTMICKLACNISVSDSFSYSLPKQANPRLLFGVSSRGGFGLQSRPLERPPPAYFFSFLNKYSSTLPLISSQISRLMGHTSASTTRLARCSA